MTSSSGLSNEELVDLLEQGDDHVFIELFSRYRQRLRRMLEIRMDHRLQGRADPSDVLQDAYLDALQRIHHYREKPELSFYVWLRQVTLQRLIDLHRRHLNAQMRDIKQEVSLDRRPVNSATSASIAFQLVAHLTSPSQLAMRAETLEQIRAALDGMDPIDREVLALRHFEELRNHEVAEVLEISEAAASNRYVRALSRLRDALENVPGFFDDQ